LHNEYINLFIVYISRIILFVFHLIRFSFISFNKLIFGMSIYLDLINPEKELIFSKTDKKICLISLSIYRISQINSQFSNINRPIYNISIKSTSSFNDKETINISRLDIFRSIIDCYSYLLKNNGLFKYGNKLLDSYLVYNSIKFDLKHKKTKFIGISIENYNMIGRSVSLACIDSGSSNITSIQYPINKKSIYQPSYLFRKYSRIIFKKYSSDNTINLSKSSSQRNHSLKDISSDNNHRILIQASDGYSNSPTRYEIDTYRLLGRTICKNDINSKLLICFHPANTLLSVSIKKFIWKIIYFQYGLSPLQFSHRQCRIEDFLLNSDVFISIAESGSLNNSINGKIPTILFDYTNTYDNLKLNYHQLNSSDNNFFNYISSAHELSEKLGFILQNKP